LLLFLFTQRHNLVTSSRAPMIGYLSGSTEVKILGKTGKDRISLSILSLRYVMRIWGKPERTDL